MYIRGVEGFYEPSDAVPHSGRAVSTADVGNAAGTVPEHVAGCHEHVPASATQSWGYTVVRVRAAAQPAIIEGMEAGMTRDWDEQGNARMTDAQRRMLNQVCSDLSSQIEWHGFRLSKDDFRHLAAGTILGWRMLPGVDRGEGTKGFIMLGGSSLNLTKTQAADAITMLLEIGDNPSGQGLKCNPVTWSEKTLLGLGFSIDDIRRAA